jgi:HlyD family secretion protein
VAAAQASLDALKAGPRSEQVAQAEANLASAQAALARLQRGPTDLELQAAQLAVDEAKDARWCGPEHPRRHLRQFVAGRLRVRRRSGPGTGGRDPREQAENQLAQLKQGADPETIAQAEQAVSVAQAQLALAKQPTTTYDLAKAQAAVDGAQAALDALVPAPGRSSWRQPRLRWPRPRRR